MSLSREKLTAGAARLVPFQVPGFDEPVHLRQLTGSDYDSIKSAAASGDPNSRDMLVRTFAASVVGEDGVRMFGDSPDELQAVGALPLAVILAVVGKANELNGLSVTEADLVGNSEATTS